MKRLKGLGRLAKRYGHFAMKDVDDFNKQHPYVMPVATAAAVGAFAATLGPATGALLAGGVAFAGKKISEK